MKTSLLDRAYRRLLVWNDFFGDGFGPVQWLPRLMAWKRTAYLRVSRLRPLAVRIATVRAHDREGYRLVQGSFVTPLDVVCPELIPPECRHARFELVLPSGAPFFTRQPPPPPPPSLSTTTATTGLSFVDLLRRRFVPEDTDDNLRDETTTMTMTNDGGDNDDFDEAYHSLHREGRLQGQWPACLHLSATGDHTFWRRRRMLAIPLARQHGISSLLLENPYYGHRKPHAQIRSNLRQVMDLYVMGLAIQYEGLALLQWLERQGFASLGVTGVSMGGHMAALVACSWPKPLALISCLGPGTAAGVFTKGLFRFSCNWQSLRAQMLREIPWLVEGCPRNCSEVECLHWLMEEVTGLSSHGRPFTTDATIILAALRDAYIPPEDIAVFEKHWPGVEVRFLKFGHLGSFLFANGLFVQAIQDGFSKLQCYHNSTTSSTPQPGSAGNSTFHGLTTGTV